MHASYFTSLNVGVQIRVDDSSIGLDDLVDLKLLPAWANEPSPAERYAHVDGEEQHREHRPGRHQGDKRHSRQDRDRRTPQRRDERRDRSGPARAGARRMHDRKTFGRKFDKTLNRQRPVERVAPKVIVHFLPRAAVFENVVAQIKHSTPAYSLFALARLFLAKPERYNVRLAATPESSLFQVGETGDVATDRELLERTAFRQAQPDFYRTEVTETEPIKGNFTSVARDRLSGTILGPTNHHDYQKRLRGLYEQRFSRRMSFADYQRQIEIVANPQLVEQWKEDVRKITRYSTLKEEPPITFASWSETERHFREKYLPNLIRSVTEITVGGSASRRISDRALYRLVEDEWTRETGSPSRMMPELAGQFRQAGLQVFRHRRGMLFVSSIRPKPLPENAAISSSVKSIIEAVAAHPGTNRKDLAEAILGKVAEEEAERAKLSLAGDLRWLIGEGHVIEFNDGALELPRAKVKQPEKEKPSQDVSASSDERSIVEAVSAGNSNKEVGSTAACATAPKESRPAGEDESILAGTSTESSAAEIGGS